MPEAKDWVAAATHQLAEGGVESVRVEALARDLGVSKGSFYWHFADREALLAAVLAAWERQGTLRIIEVVDEEADTGPRRLWSLFQKIFGSPIEIDGFEAALRSWAARAPEVQKAVRRVDRRRVGYVAELLIQSGFERNEAKRRAELLYCTLVGEFLQRTYGKPRLSQPALRSMYAMLLSRGTEAGDG